MGKFYETMPASLMPWLRAQHCFWVASAPLSAHGHVNVSPKGGPYFGVADERTFWYLDLTGSGVETISHLHEPGNGRVTVLFNAFTGGPRIVRLWGHGAPSAPRQATRKARLMRLHRSRAGVRHAGL